MLLYIVRHGETRLNEKGCLQGWIDEPLNQKGRDLALETGEGLKDVRFDLIFTSPLIRAKETAELVSKPSRKQFGEIPIVEDDRLKEINWGSWEGEGCLENNFSVPCDHYNQFFTDAYDFEGAPDGESVKEVCERTADFYQKLIGNPEYQDKTILISTHGYAMRAMLRQVYTDLSDFWHGHVPYNCAVNIVEVKDGKSTLLGDDKIYYDPALCVNNYKVVDKIANCDKVNSFL